MQRVLDRTLHADERPSRIARSIGCEVSKSLVEKFWWEAPRMTNAGRPVPHESARGHVTGDALYTDDLVGRFPEPAARLAGRWRRTRTRGVTSLDVAPALDEAGRRHGLTGADVPGEGDTGATVTTSRCFPREVMFHHQPVAWVLGETLEAARRGAARVRVDVRAAAGHPDDRGGDRRRQLS